MTVPPFWGCLIAATHPLNQAVDFSALGKLAYAGPVEDNVTAVFIVLPDETGTFTGVMTKPRTHVRSDCSAPWVKTLSFS
jgi:hypothetical protein